MHYVSVIHFWSPETLGTSEQWKSKRKIQGHWSNFFSKYCFLMPNHYDSATWRTKFLKEICSASKVRLIRHKNFIKRLKNGEVTGVPQGLFSWKWAVFGIRKQYFEKKYFSDPEFFFLIFTVLKSLGSQEIKNVSHLHSAFYLVNLFREDLCLRYRINVHVRLFNLGNFSHLYGLIKYLYD